MIHLYHGWVIAVLIIATFPLVYYLLAIFAALAFSSLEPKRRHRQPQHLSPP